MPIPEPHHSRFYRPDALPATQPTASKHNEMRMRMQTWLRSRDAFMTATRITTPVRPTPAEQWTTTGEAMTEGAAPSMSATCRRIASSSLTKSVTRRTFQHSNVSSSTLMAFSHTKSGSAGSPWVLFLHLFNWRTSEDNLHRFFYHPDVLPVTQPTVSKHWRKLKTLTSAIENLARQQLTGLTLWHVVWTQTLHGNTNHARIDQTAKYNVLITNTDDINNNRFTAITEVNLHQPVNFPFSTLTLLAERQEGHLACKNWVVRYWRGYLSGVRCKWFAYGPADATATRSSLTPVKSGTV